MALPRVPKENLRCYNDAGLANHIKEPEVYPIGQPKYTTIGQPKYTTIGQPKYTTHTLELHISYSFYSKVQKEDALPQ